MAELLKSPLKSDDTSTKETIAISSFSVHLLVLSIPLHSHKIRRSFNAVFFVLCFLVVYKEWKYLSNQFRYRGKLISCVYYYVDALTACHYITQVKDKIFNVLYKVYWTFSV